MKIKLLLALLLAYSTFTHAQNYSDEYRISGKVVDEETGEPLEYATISITSTDDPSNVTGGITDPSGNFEISVEDGDYNIKVEYISYTPKTFNNRNVDRNIDLGTIVLSFAANSLDEVTVISETTTVDVQLDKKIYNIGKDLTTAGGTVTDALNNVPSVSVDLEGGISLRGNENVRILINGKPSALAGFGDTNVLQQLPAEAIERVEVITSPSARYDAEGTAGILNIILRKEKILGFNGSLNANLGNPDLAGLAANLNYRTEKFNIFTTTGYRYSDSPGNGYFDTQFFENDSLNPQFNRIIEDRDISRINRNLNFNVGMEYYLTESSSLTGSVFYRKGNDRDQTDNATSSFIDEEVVLESLRTERQRELEDSYQISFNYVNDFNDEGHKLTADFQYANDKETQNRFIDEDILVNNNDNPGIISERIRTAEEQNEYLIQTDYVLPFGEGSQFEAGYRGTFENTVTDFTVDQETAPNSMDFQQNDILTNIFDYTENVNALYTQLGTKFGNFSVLAGLRLENTQLKGEIEAELTEEELQSVFGFPINTSFDNNYLGLFPTLNIIYELGEEENISFGYNRRINRPRGWYINPFPDRDSRNNVFQGNPNLQPAFANAFDLGYLKRWDKLTFTSSVYYQRETDAFERVEEIVDLQGQGNPQGTSVIRTIPVNLSVNERTGGEIGLLYNPSDWLRLNGSFNIFQFTTEGFFNGVDYGFENTSWFARFSSKVTLPAKIDWQTNAFYRGARQNAQTDTDGILSIDLALSKDIGENATLSFNVRDLLNSQRREQFTTNQLFTRESEFQWRVRRINLSLIYRFNQKKNERGERNSDYNDEDSVGSDFQG